MVEEVSRVDDKTFHVTLKDRGEVKVRLSEVLPEIFGLALEDMEVTRLEMFGWDGRWSAPVESERVWTAKS